MSRYDFGMGCDSLFLRLKKVYSMILNNNNNDKINSDHYLTCRLPPQAIKGGLFNDFVERSCYHLETCM